MGEFISSTLSLNLTHSLCLGGWGGEFFAYIPRGRWARAMLTAYKRITRQCWGVGHFMATLCCDRWAVCYCHSLEFKKTKLLTGWVRWFGREGRRSYCLMKKTSMGIMKDAKSKMHEESHKYCSLVKSRGKGMLIRKAFMLTLRQKRWECKTLWQEQLQKGNQKRKWKLQRGKYI